MDARREADDQDARPSPHVSTDGTASASTPDFVVTATAAARRGGSERREGGEGGEGHAEGKGDAAAQPLVTSERLRKLRRNERDRQRSFAKRESMKQMRKLVQELEAQKKQLVARSAAADDAHASETQEKALTAPVVTSPSLSPSTEAPVRRENYVQLASEIEAFRRQNALMTQQLRERDLFNSSMQNLLLDFQHDDSDSDSGGQQLQPQRRQSDQQQRRQRYNAGGPRPMSNIPGVCFTPLTREEGLACVRQTLQQIANARLLYASEENFRQSAKFLGWSQFAQRQGTTITFATKKTLPNVTPRQLLQTSWDLLADSESIRRLTPEQLHTHIRPLQKLSEDLMVVDRRTEDYSRTGVGSQTLAVRTIYVLFRVADADGTQSIGMKTIDLPLVKQLLRDDEFWCDILYWVRFSPDGGEVKAEVKAEAGAEPQPSTTVEFGGCNTYTREEIASSWLTELMFLASRWEALAVAPSLLKP